LAERAANFRAHGAGIQRAQTWQGAFWADRYHSTTTETDEHLHRCLVYIEYQFLSELPDYQRCQFLAAGNHPTFLEPCPTEESEPHPAFDQVSKAWATSLQLKTEA
jgi:hypothetical protein